jgi:hypothetical protein
MFVPYTILDHLTLSCAHSSYKQALNPVQLKSQGNDAALKRKYKRSNEKVFLCIN